MRLLLAVDSVQTTEILMNAVASRPWPRGTRARIISVVEDDAIPQDAWRQAGYSLAAVQQEMRRREEQVSAMTLDPLKELGIRSEAAIMRGDPAYLITHEARTWPADLILMRAHNRTDFRSLKLGSVAKSAARTAPCSVEVVRAVRDDLSVVANGHMKIILATDGSEQSVDVARAVAERPWPEGTEVKVMSMVNPLIYSIEEMGLFESGGTLRAHKAIGEAAQILNEAGLKTSAEVIAGRPFRRIINEARDWGADLIVVGKHDRRGLRRLLEGSVSERVAGSAPCSVKIVREPDVD